MVWLIISDGTIGRWEIYESEDEALKALENEEARYESWLKKQKKGLVFHPWGKSLLIKVGEVVKIKTRGSEQNQS